MTSDNSSIARSEFIERSFKLLDEREICTQEGVLKVQAYSFHNDGRLPSERRYKIRRPDRLCALPTEEVLSEQELIARIGEQTWNNL